MIAMQCVPMKCNISDCSARCTYAVQGVPMQCNAGFRSGGSLVTAGKEAKVATRDPGVQDWEQYARVQGAEYRI